MAPTISQLYSYPSADFSVLPSYPHFQRSRHEFIMFSLALVHMLPAHYPPFFSIMFFHLLFLYWSFMMLLDTEVKGTVYKESGRRHMHTQALPCILEIWDKCTDFAVGQSFRVWKLHELNKTSSVKDIPFYIESNQGSASWGEMAALEAQDRILGGLVGFFATGAE